MQESDVQVFRAFSGSLVYQPYALAVTFGQSVANSVFYAEGHMVYAMEREMDIFLAISCSS